jgi:hypothetical protein
MNMKTEDILTPELTLKWDEGLNSLLVINPKTEAAPIRIHSDTIKAMNFEEACAFIGSRVALLMPALRSIYIDPETGTVRPDGAPNH